MSLLAPKTTGFGLIEVVVAVGLLSVVMVGIIQLGKISGKQQTQSNITFHADQIRRRLTQTLQNPAAWQNTVSDSTNTHLNCLRDHTDCTSNSGLILLKDAQGQLVYDPLNSTTNGFSPTGELCNTFDDLNGNDACPFRVDLKWQPVCSGTCIDPQPRVTGAMRYRPKSPARTIALNGINYGVDVTIGAGISSGSGSFGSYKTLMMNQVYQAATDGFILVSNNCSSGFNSIAVNTQQLGMLNNPATRTDSNTLSTTTGLGGITPMSVKPVDNTVPVPKNSYFMVLQCLVTTSVSYIWLAVGG